VRGAAGLHAKARPQALIGRQGQCPRLELLEGGPEVPIDPIAHHLGLATAPDDHRDGAMGHRLGRRHAEMLEEVGVGVRIGAVARGMPVDGSAVVKVLDLLIARIRVENDRIAARERLDLLEVPGVVPFPVDGAGEVQLPAAQALVAQVSKGGHHQVMPLGVPAGKEPADGQDRLRFFRPVRLGARDVDRWIDHGGPPVPVGRDPAGHVVRLADDVLKRFHLVPQHHRAEQTVRQRVQPIERMGLSHPGTSAVGKLAQHHPAPSLGEERDHVDHRQVEVIVPGVPDRLGAQEEIPVEAKPRHRVQHAVQARDPAIGRDHPDARKVELESLFVDRGVHRDGRDDLHIVLGKGLVNGLRRHPEVLFAAPDGGTEEGRVQADP